MTPEQAIQIIESVLLDDSIKGFSVKQVLAIYQALTFLKKHQEPKPEAAVSS